MLAQMLVQRGNPARALASFDAAVDRLDPDLDASSFTALLLNRARCLALLGRFSAAQQGYAQALQVARRHRLDALVFNVRQNLAEIELLRGDFEKAHASYLTVAHEERQQAEPAIHWVPRQEPSPLYINCLGCFLAGCLIGRGRLVGRG